MTETASRALRWLSAATAALLTPWIGPHVDQYVPVGWILFRSVRDAPGEFWIIAAAACGAICLVWYALFSGMVAWFRRRRRDRGSSDERAQPLEGAAVMRDHITRPQQNGNHFTAAAEMRAMNSERRYVPALGYDVLTRVYDPVVALTTREQTFKRRLIRHANVREGHAVLDLACGTGTLAVWIRRRVPGAHVVGVDGDPNILGLAKRKAQRRGIDVVFDHGLSTNLPYESASFDRVVSSLFFHHLSHEDKARTVQEVFRVLKPDGEFHVADWGKPQNVLMRALFVVVRSLDGFANTRDNVQGKLPELFRNGGFEDVQVRDEIATAFGTLAIYAMKKRLSSRADGAA